MVRVRSTPPGRCGDRVQMRCVPDPFGDWQCRLFDSENAPCGAATIRVVGPGIKPFGEARIGFRAKF